LGDLAESARLVGVDTASQGNPVREKLAQHNQSHRRQLFRQARVVNRCGM
jgi:hypothetical protein